MEDDGLIETMNFNQVLSALFFVLITLATEFTGALQIASVCPEVFCKLLKEHKLTRRRIHRTIFVDYLGSLNTQRTFDKIRWIFIKRRFGIVFLFAKDVVLPVEEKGDPFSTPRR